MSESEQERTLDILQHRAVRIQETLDNLHLELRTVAIFFVAFIMALEYLPAHISLTAAIVVSGVFSFINYSRLKKYGTF